MRKALVYGVAFLFLFTACGGSSSSSSGAKFTGNTSAAAVTTDNIVNFAEGALGAGQMGFYGGPMGDLLLEGLFMMMSRTAPAVVVETEDFVGGCDEVAQGSGSAKWLVENVDEAFIVRVSFNDYCNDGSYDGSTGPSTEGETWNGSASLTLVGGDSDFQFTFEYNKLSIFEPGNLLRRGMLDSDIIMEEEDETEIFSGTVVWDNFMPEFMVGRLADVATPPVGSEDKIIVNLIASFIEGEETYEYWLKDVVISDMGEGFYHVVGQVYFDDQGYVDVDTLEYLTLGEEGPENGVFSLTGDDEMHPATLDIFTDMGGETYYALIVWNPVEESNDYLCFDSDWNPSGMCF